MLGSIRELAGGYGRVDEGRAEILEAAYANSGQSA